MRVVRLAVMTVLGCLLVGLVFEFAAPRVAIANEDEDAARWSDATVLRQHLAAACAAVEEVCGAQFGARPQVRVSRQHDIVRILRSAQGGQMGMLETTPDEARRYLAYYDPLEHVIHILPHNLVEVAAYFRAPDLLSEGMLRAVLVHEATHALDFQRFPVRWTLACCEASDERLVTEAVLEGHAQLITEQVCRKWGIPDAFQRLTRLYSGALMGSDEAAFLGFDQEAAFAYLQGHDFMRSVLQARGRQAVEAALRDPPFETRVVDRPLLWLESHRRGEEPDLQAVLEIFRPLVPSRDWEVSKWRVLGPAVPLMKDARAGGDAVMESYIDNHGLYAGTSGGNRYFNVFIAYCRSAQDAEQFVRALRGVDEARDNDPSWQPARRRDGVGPGLRLPGFSSRRRATGGASGSELTLQVVLQGRHVIELSTYGMANTDRKAQERTLDLAARLLRASPPSATAVALRAHVKRFLTARAIGRRGQASVLMRDLLPTKADLRRVVHPEVAKHYADSYTGLTLELRTTIVQHATVDLAFPGAGAGSAVRAWAATTEQLAEGSGWSAKFPPSMQKFCRERGAPGMTWLLLTITPAAGGEGRPYACFARLGDRFLWIEEPWTFGR